MYTTHIVPPSEPGNPPAYYRHQINAWAMTSNPAAFRDGATWYRNGRDWAKEQRDAVIIRANEITRPESVEGHGHEPNGVIEGACGDTETSNEDADETDDDAETESLSTLTSFAVASNSQFPSTQTEDEDTSDEHVRLSAKRSSSQSPKARRHKRKPGSRRSDGSEQ